MELRIPLLFFAIGMLVVSWNPVSAVDSYSYSIMHISDTQSLSSMYPSTLNDTFSYLESMKNACNISAIIVTGDLVNNGDQPAQWKNYLDARSLTTIPLYEIPGDEDLDEKSDNSLFKTFVGNKTDWNTTINDFVFIGIGYTENPLRDEDIAHYISIIEGNPQKFTLIAVHNYYNKDFTVSPLGKSIQDNLVLKPTFVLSGHAHATTFRSRLVNSRLYVEDLTNYQEMGNFSAGKLYTVYCADREVSQITVRDVSVSPRRYLDAEITVYKRTGEKKYPEETENPAYKYHTPSGPTISLSPYSPHYFIDPSKIINPVPALVFEMVDVIEDTLEERYIHDTPDANDNPQVINPSHIISHDYRAIFQIVDMVGDHRSEE